MSAYVVDKAHIDAIVRYACSPEKVWTKVGERHRYLELGDADEIGRDLWLENVTSVAYRYDDADDLPGPASFEAEDALTYKLPWEAWKRPAIPAVAVLKAVGGLEYQSCEHPGWESSHAYSLLQAIKESAIRDLPGYDEASWEITANA